MAGVGHLVFELAIPKKRLLGVWGSKFEMEKSYMRNLFVPKKMGRAIVFATLLLFVMVPVVGAQEGGDTLPFVDFDTFVAWLIAGAVMITVNILLEKWSIWQNMKGSTKNRVTALLTPAYAWLFSHLVTVVPTSAIAEFNQLVISTYATPMFFVLKEIFHSYVGRRLGQVRIDPPK